VRALRGHLANWVGVGLFAWLVMLSPLKGLLGRSGLARRRLRLEFRDGRHLVIPVNDMQAYVEVFLLGDYDIPGYDWSSVMTIVDAGANVGTATLWFAGRCPNARIVAVEPGAAARALLERNLDANLLAGRVEVLAAAVGGENGRGVYEEGEATILGRVVPVGADKQLPQAVDVVGLESLAAGGLDLLKLDCEGAEYDILLRAPESALRQVRAVVGEYHPAPGHGPTELEARLRASGFATAFRAHPTLPGFGNFTARRSGVSPTG